MANLNFTPLSYQPTTNQAPVLTEYGYRLELIKNGYCPDCNRMLRKKTLLGRWKTLHEVCPSCPTNASPMVAMPQTASNLQPIQSPATSATLPIQMTPNFQTIQSSQNASPAVSSSVPTMATLHPPASQVQRKRFCDGGVWGEYVGELDAFRLRSGRGEMKWENGKVYKGEWKDDKRNGQGTCRIGDGSVYDGEFKNGKWDGRGTYHGQDGSLEVGTYMAGWDSGEGVHWSKDRRTAWLLKNGGAVREIGLSEAKATAKRIGFPDAPK